MQEAGLSIDPVGEIRAVKMGRAVRIEKESLDRFRVSGKSI